MKSAGRQKTERTDVILFQVESDDSAREVWSGTLDQFLADNAESLTEDEVARITRKIQAGRRAAVPGFVGSFYELRIAAEVL